MFRTVWLNWRWTLIASLLKCPLSSAYLWIRLTFWGKAFSDWNILMKIVCFEKEMVFFQLRGWTSFLKVSNKTADFLTHHGEMWTTFLTKAMICLSIFSILFFKFFNVIAMSAGDRQNLIKTIKGALIKAINVPFSLANCLNQSVVTYWPLNCKNLHHLVKVVSKACFLL